MIKSDQGLFEIGIINSSLTLQAQQAQSDKETVQFSIPQKVINFEKDKEFRYYNAEKLGQDLQHQKNYICVRDQDVFQIKIKSLKNNESKQNRMFDQLETYGVVAYLDGNRVPGKRSFVNYTHIQGFKLSTGYYKQFMFSFADNQPNESSQGQNSEDQITQIEKEKPKDVGSTKDSYRKHQGKQCSIIIEFYNTEKFYRKDFSDRKSSQLSANLFRANNQQSRHKSLVKGQNSKNFDDNLSVQGGEIFKANQKNQSQSQSFRKRDQKLANKLGVSHDDNMVEDYRNLWDQGPIDSIEIKYSQWAALQSQNLVDIKTYSHLRLLTEDQIGTQDFMAECLKTIVSEHKRIHWKDCDSALYEASGGNHKISDYFDFPNDDMKKFLLKKGCFEIDAEGLVAIIENQQIQPKNKPQRQKQQKNLITSVIEID